MIRKVYWDFIREKIASGKFGWLLRRGWQYLLTFVSYPVGKPLCGPVLGTLAVTYRCNYNCRMCDIPLQKDKLEDQGLREFSTERMKELIRDFSLLGVAGIGFTGGEPLLRDDIFELLSFSKELGMLAHLNTNGFFLDEAHVKKLIEAKVDSLNISLDGATAETHDKIRGHKGAFDRVLAALKLIEQERKRQDSSLRLKVVTVLSEDNIDEVKDLIKLSYTLGTDCIEFVPQQCFAASLQQETFRYSDAFLKKVDKVVEDLLKFKAKGVAIENSPRHLKLFRRSFEGRPSPLTCYAAFNSYAVDCYGRVYPCMSYLSWGRSVGNLKDMGLKEFFRSASYNKQRKAISRCRDCYLNCQAELNLMFNPFFR
jgi:MoaA/NifB/PqqE/SkfB family radical SAM enzyme